MKANSGYTVHHPLQPHMQNSLLRATSAKYRGSVVRLVTQKLTTESCNAQGTPSMHTATGRTHPHGAERTDVRPTGKIAQKRLSSIVKNIASMSGTCDRR